MKFIVKLLTLIKIEKFHNDLQLAVLYREEKEEDLLLELMNDINHEQIEGNTLQYLSIIELFENEEGFYKIVSRDKNTFKINKNSHYKIRITMINLNQTPHKFNFHEYLKM